MAAGDCTDVLPCGCWWLYVGDYTFGLWLLVITPTCCLVAVGGYTVDLRLLVIAPTCCFAAVGGYTIGLRLLATALTCCLAAVGDYTIELRLLVIDLQLLVIIRLKQCCAAQCRQQWTSTTRKIRTLKA